MVFIKLTEQEKHTRKHSKYEIQAHRLAEAETEKNRDFLAYWNGMQLFWNVLKSMKNSENSQYSIVRQIILTNGKHQNGKILATCYFF